MTPKVFTLRRAAHKDKSLPCLPPTHKITVGRGNPGLCPIVFTRITGLSIPVGGRLRVKLVVVQGKRKKK